MREVAEAHRAGGRQQREDRLDRVAHAGPDRRDVVGRRTSGDRLREQTRARGGEERVERDPLQRVGRERAERLLRARRCGRPSGSPSASRACSTFAASWNVLQSRSRASRRSRSSNRDSSSSSSMSSRPGKQAARLQLHERRRDEQELGGRLEIDPLHALDLGEERVDDAHERDLPEVDLFLEDQVQEEVERALEHRRRDLVGHGRQGIQRGSRMLYAPSAGAEKRPVTGRARR